MTETLVKIDNGAKVALKHGLHRSPHWEGVEKQFIKDHPNCFACESQDYGKVGVQVHHAITPYHIAILCERPDLELDPRNLVCLCETEKNRPAQNHHLLIGHLKEFESYNPDVLADIKLFFGKTKEEIENDPIFQEKVKNRPKNFDPSNLEEVQKMKDYLNTVLPPDPVILSKYFPKGI